MRSLPCGARDLIALINYILTLTLWLIKKQKKKNERKEEKKEKERKERKKKNTTARGEPETKK